MTTDFQTLGEFFKDSRSADEFADEKPNIFINAASFGDRDVPHRGWLINGMIPSNTVTLLSGDGGTGKSLLALQLAIAVAAPDNKLDWLGRKPEQGRVLYVGAEDDADEMHRRINDIIGFRPGIDWPDLSGLEIANLAERDALLAVLNTRQNTLTPSQLYLDIKQRVEETQPKLVVLDTLADFFGGNESDRAQVRQFIAQLRTLCIKQQTTMLLLSHPSLSGMASGSGLSGSTAWNGSVRSRLYMTRVIEDGEEADKNLRKLTVMKSNYGATGDGVFMRWEEGYFHAEAEEAGLDRVALEAKEDRVFMRLLADCEKQDRDLLPKTIHTTFAKMPEREGITKSQFARAFERLLSAGVIKLEKDGPASRRRRLVQKVEK